MQIMVAIPNYDGRMHVQTAGSLLEEQLFAYASGMELTTVFLPSCSLITHGRNQLVSDFMNSECERLVFIDNDIAWQVGSLTNLALKPEDIIGGAYRYKSEDENYPVIFKDKIIRAASGLIEVESLPAGFLAINKKVFNDLKAAHPERAYTIHGRLYHGYFHNPIANNAMLGEDAAFCADYRAMGGSIWLDPEITLTHIGGPRRFIGCIGDWLKSKAVVEDAGQ